MDNSRAIRWQQEAAVRRARKRLDSAFDVGRVSDRGRDDLDVERRSRDLRIPHEVIVGSRLGSRDECDTRKARCDLLEHCQPLACNAFLVKHDAGEITAWPSEVCSEARS